MRAVATPSFKKAVKRLHANQKADVDEAVRAVIESPFLGEQKSGDLAWLRVYKFHMVDQRALLGYEIEDAETLILHSVGSHENFCRDLKSRKS